MCNAPKASFQPSVRTRLRYTITQHVLAIIRELVGAPNEVADIILHVIYQFNVSLPPLGVQVLPPKRGRRGLFIDSQAWDDDPCIGS